MVQSLMKKKILRCCDCLSLPDYLEVLALFLFLKLPLKKLGPLIHSMKFLLSELLHISDLPSGFPWVVWTGTLSFYLDMLDDMLGIGCSYYTCCFSCIFGSSSNCGQSKVRGRITLLLKVTKITTNLTNSFFSSEWAQVGIDVYIPHRKYQVKSHSSPWFAAAFATAITVEII